MRVIVGNLWTVPAVWKLVPTNLDVRADGNAVMGAGIARQAATRYPGLARELGEFLLACGEQRYLSVPPYHALHYRLTCLPTKTHWREPSRLYVITAALRRFREDIRFLDLPANSTIALPLLGCGLGGLDPNVVIPRLHALLDGQFVLVMPSRRSV